MPEQRMRRIDCSACGEVHASGPKSARRCTRWSAWSTSSGHPGPAGLWPAMQPEGVPVPVTARPLGVGGNRPTSERRSGCPEGRSGRRF